MSVSKEDIKKKAKTRKGGKGWQIVINGKVIREFSSHELMMIYLSDDGAILEDYRWYNTTKKKKTPKTPKFKCIETGKVYESFYAANKELGVARDVIKRDLEGKTKWSASRRKYHFEIV